MTIHLNTFTVSSLIVALLHFPLALLFFLKGKPGLRMYAPHVLSIGLWGLGAFLIGSTNNYAFANLCWKFTYSNVLLIPPFLLHFICQITKKPYRILVFAAYSQAILFILLTIRGNLWGTLYQPFNSFYYPLETPLFRASFVLWLSTFSLAYTLFFWHHRGQSQKEKYERVVFVIGIIFGFIGGVINFLPSLGYKCYPFGNIILPVFTFTTLFAILKYQTFEVQLVIKKGVIYTAALALIFLAYLGFILLLEALIDRVLHYNSRFLGALIAFLLGAIFLPLRNCVELWLNKTLFNKTPLQAIEENKFLYEEVAKKEKFEAVATLASGIAHEIKNPLTAIKTFVEYLPERKNDTEFLNKFTKVVGAEINRVDHLVHQLLEFAKPSPLQLQDTQLNDLLMDSLDLLSHEIHKKQVQIITNLGPLPKIKADSNKLKQAFLNIIINAIESMSGGGALTIKTRLLGREAIEISIQDTGPGIDPNILPQIFDPFYSKKEKGTGLGLAITRGIIEEHKGSIKAESKLTKGSVFTLKLPI